jgi:hypothetical protein
MDMKQQARLLKEYLLTTALQISKNKIKELVEDKRGERGQERAK